MWYDGLLPELDAFSLVARRRLGGGALGERRSARRGAGLEFADHRPYVPGDDIRALDWNAYRAHRRLFIRQFEEQEDLSVTLLLDCSRSMSFGSGAKFFSARRLALALSQLALVGLDCVSAHGLFSEKIVTLPPLRGRQRYFSVLKFLDALEPSGPTDLARSVTLAAERSRRRGLALFFTDGYDGRGLERALDVLRGARFEPILIEIEDARDIPSRPLGEVVLVDVETEKEQGAWVTRERLLRYREQVEARKREMARIAFARGISHARVDVAWSLAQSLRVLERAGVLRR